MITVKALKEQRQGSSLRREDYVLDDVKKRSFIPLVFLLFLTGCAAYLKSFLPVTLVSRKDDPERPRNDEDSRPIIDSEEKIGAQPDDDVTGSIGRAAKSSDNVVPITPRFTLPPEELNTLLASDSPLDFSSLKPTALSAIDMRPIGDVVRPSNDNRPAGAGNSAAGGSGGGGGGGGGGAERNEGHGGNGGSPSAGPGGQGPLVPPGPVQPPGPTENPPVGSDPGPLRNRAPRTNGPVHLQDVVGCHAYLIALLSLLSGASDPDGDQLTPTNVVASSGTITPADGGWLYVPDQGMLGEVTLTYTISDGKEAVEQTAYFNVIDEPPVVGSSFDDNLLGTHCNDIIDARMGDDNIDAREGDDVVFGGDGDDHIIGGDGNDIIYAGSGNDIVFTGNGNDIVFGGPGNDRLFGEAGADTLFGEDGSDLLVGGDGADILLGGAGDDALHGDAGNDALDGGAGNDDLHGGEGADVLLGGGGSDTLHGDAGDDVISDGAGSDVVHGGEGDDYITAAIDAASDYYAGDAGEDTLDYSAATASLEIDMADGTARGSEIGDDAFSGFETVVAGRGDDHLRSGSGSASMTGGAGNDIFEFETPDQSSLINLVRKITDFTVGDRLLVAHYEIQDRSGSNSGSNDWFENVYLSNDENRYRAVRFRFERYDDQDTTVVDVQDGAPENIYSIELLGYHQLEEFHGIS